MWWDKSKPAQVWIGNSRFGWSHQGRSLIRRVESSQESCDVLAQHVAASGIKRVTVWLSGAVSQLECVSVVLGAKNKAEAESAIRVARAGEGPQPTVDVTLATWPQNGSNWPIAVTDDLALRQIAFTCRRLEVSIKPWWSHILSRSTAREEKELLAVFDGEALLTCQRTVQGEVLNAATMPMSSAEVATRVLERRRLTSSVDAMTCWRLALPNESSSDDESEAPFAFASFLRCGDAF